MEVEDAAPPTQADEPDAGTLAEEEFSEPWARLIGMGPTSSFGIVDLNQRVILFGKVAKNSNAHIKFNDPRVSSMHCRIFLDDNGLAHVIDLSSNGTWWNNQRMGKNQIRRLQNADNIVLLNPNPKHASMSSGNAVNRLRSVSDAER
jgi:pSer/pThr/pTyr-binding forkhead associated (FHA) protein